MKSAIEEIIHSYGNGQLMIQLEKKKLHLAWKNTIFIFKIRKHIATENAKTSSVMLVFNFINDNIQFFINMDWMPLNCQVI